MKRAFSLILTVIMSCGLLSVSAMAAVEDYPQEFREGKTKIAETHRGTFAALQEDGSLWVSGDVTAFGNAVDHDSLAGSRLIAETPKKVADNVVSFQFNRGYFAYIMSDGSLWVYRESENLLKLDNVSEISIGNVHFLALQKNGTLWGWGGDDAGQLGIGDRLANPSADDPFDCYIADEPIKIMDHVAHISASGATSLALKTDGTVWAWGNNSAGQVGKGEFPSADDYEPDTYYTGEGPAFERDPIQILADVQTIALSEQGYYAVAVKNDGSLWGWGALPAPNRVPPTFEDVMPTPTKLMENTRRVIPALHTLFVIQNDNSLWQLTGKTTFEKVAENVSSACVLPANNDNNFMLLKTDGTLWAIGQDLEGRLCDGGIEIVDKAAPHQCLLDNVVYINDGIAVKKNGSLWVFGMNRDSSSRHQVFYHVGQDWSITTPIQLTGPANTPLKSAPAAPQATESNSFNDVAAGAYYYDAVQWAVSRQITAGTTATTFSPNTTCTNGQILTFLWRAKGQPEPTISNPFTDVGESAYYYKAALWAYENGMVSGASLGADTPCTRSQTVTYLWKLAGQPAAASASAFADVEGGAEYAQAVSWAVEQGITSGTSATTFAPDGTCTRGQIVTFLYRDMGK